MSSSGAVLGLGLLLVLGTCSGCVRKAASEQDDQPVQASTVPRVQQVQLEPDEVSAAGSSTGRSADQATPGTAGGEEEAQLQPEGVTGILPISPMPDNPAESMYPVVVIDPGHGTRDVNLRITGHGSAAQLDGRTVHEHEVTLDYSMWIMAALRRRGVPTYSTRDYEHPWFDVDYAGHDQEANNRMRADFAAQHGAELFVRVHFDGSSDPELRGFSTWYNDQSRVDEDGALRRSSLAAAEAIHQQLGEVMETPDLGIRRFDRPIYGFVYAVQPAVLLELAFLSSARDSEYVMREEVLREISEAVADGIVLYLEQGLLPEPQEGAAEDVQWPLRYTQALE